MDKIVIKIWLTVRNPSALKLCMYKHLFGTYFMCDSVYVLRGMARRRSSPLSSSSNSWSFSMILGSFPCITPPNSPHRIPPKKLNKYGKFESYVQSVTRRFSGRWNSWGKEKINPCAFPLLVSGRTEQNALLCPDYYRFEMEYYPRWVNAWLVCYIIPRLLIQMRTRFSS